MYFFTSKANIDSIKWNRLSIPLARGELKRMLLQLNKDPKEYSFHSAKRGAATTASMKGYNYEEIQRMGRWRSRSMVQLYDQSSPEGRITRPVVPLSFPIHIRTIFE